MLSSVQRARSECSRPWWDGRNRSGPVRFAFVLLLVAFVVAVAAPSHVSAEGGAYVDTDRLNLRSEPGTYAEVIGKLYQNDPIEVLAGPTEDGWYQVNYYGTVGWVYGGFINIGGWPGWDDGSGSVGSGGGSVWVATDVLNIRADATTRSEVIHRAWNGAELTVLGEAYNGFLPVAYDGVEGWANTAYLSWGGNGGSGNGSSDKWIDVNRTTHTVTLYEGGEAIASYWAAMGFEDNSYGFYATAVGTYYVHNKNPELFYTDYADAYFMYWVGFDPERENGFHSYTMDENGRVLKNGSAPTGGCVATEPDAAWHIFQFADIGTRVEVHW